MVRRYTTSAVFVFMATFYMATSFASGAGSEKEAIALVEDAMKKISADDIEGATDMLRRYSSIDWGEYNAMSKDIADLYRRRPAGFGDPLGYTYVKHESIGDTVLRVTFIEKFKRKPLQWDFFFYKPGQDWQLTSIAFHASELTMFDIVKPPRTGPTLSPQ